MDIKISIFRMKTCILVIQFFPTFSTYFRGFVKIHGLLRYEEFEGKIDFICGY